jgi:alpha-D-ribose 1-methylphosphonate 5-triphosphate diphosphatase PhnM
MNNIYNAVSDCMEDLEYADHFETFIECEVADRVYTVLFRDRANGNKEFTIRVEYCTEVDRARMLEDAGWDQWVTLQIIHRHRVSQATAELICENLAIHIDEDHFDTDSEDESDDDDSTIASEPLTPPPSQARRARS